MAKRTSKSIAERIDVDYYRKPHPLRGWKRMLSWGAFWVTLAAILVITFGLGDHRMYQAGPVSDYHKLIANDCNRCHSETWQTGKRLLTLSEAHRSVPDQTCSECHAGPLHNENMIAEDVERCSECHREHRGNAALATVSDSHCIRCHADLKTQDGEHRFEQSITAFATHPEFRLIKEQQKDPGVLRFNHAVHLAEPILQPFGHGQETGSEKKVQLQCADCHQPDGSRGYMKPIKFDQHCAQCHSSALTFDPQLFPQQPVPHGLPIDVVRGTLRELYAQYVTENRQQVLGAPAEPGNRRRMPWQSLPVELDEKEFDWVNQRVQQANQTILDRKTGCVYCHEVESNEQGVPVKIRPPNLPERWMPHSVFKHDPHRMLSCEACHTGARESKLTSDVLMPGIDNCKTCHGPHSQTPGSARADCVECHLYHNHKLDLDLNGPYPLDPQQWKRGSQEAPSATQASLHPGQPTLGMTGNDLLFWLHSKP